MKYHSVTIDVEGEDDLNRVLAIARSMPSYYRIYIDEIEYYELDEEPPYVVEILFANEHDATLFHLKL